MLTQQEKDFLRYWENNRLRRKKTMRQFLVGIPIGLLFVIPIVINFTSGWYKRAQMEANNQDFNPVVLLVALLVIVVFTAIFYQRHQWDQYEQRYRELLAREKRDIAGAPGGATGETGVVAGGPAGVAEPAAGGPPRSAEALRKGEQASEPAPDVDFSEKGDQN
jgi:hypothetical protein